MKRLMMILMVLSFTLGISAASESSIRSRALFLTDKMAYELRLNSSQVDDVYEINYDFFNAVGDIMDNTLRGESWALDEYYDALDIRNDDMRYVLSAVQYNRFLNLEYFSRPIYQTSSTWKLRIYFRYPNMNKYYYGRPSCYNTYYGDHYRSNFSYSSYYRNRYPNISHTNISFRKNGQGYYYNNYARDFNNGGYKVKARKGYQDENNNGMSQRNSNNSYNSGNRNTIINNSYNNGGRNTINNNSNNGNRNTYNSGNTNRNNNNGIFNGNRDRSNTYNNAGNGNTNNNRGNNAYKKSNDNSNSSNRDFGGSRVNRNRNQQDAPSTRSSQGSNQNKSNNQNTMNKDNNSSYRSRR